MIDEKPTDEAQSAVASARLHRAVYLSAGFVLLALGVIGAFLPVMPTTIFIILAAWCFGRSSPRLERWLLAHPRFGPSLTAWRREGAIPRRAKAYATGGMLLGFAIFLGTVHPRWPLLLLVTAVIGLSMAYVLSRPAPRAQPPL